MEQVNDKLWNWASLIDPNTLEQANRISRLPIIHDHVALMPDAHFGIGTTVGSVVPTEGAIIPSAVGVDLGCGMIACRTNLTATDLPDLQPFINDLSRDIPAGVGQGHGNNGSVYAKKAWEDWYALHRPPRDYSTLMDTAADQFGTLGSGNHFVEVCLDERDSVWIVLHSGSRGIGNKLASGHIKTARGWAGDLAHQYGMEALEDPDLAWFIEGTPEFQAYIQDMLWAQDYAMGNRHAMMDAAFRSLHKYVPHLWETQRINCHHNYASLEEYNGRFIWITRKGAVNAEAGMLGIIPGSMGTRSYIVQGLGNEASWNSCSHGAGRRLSRGRATREISIEDMREAMAHVGAWQAKDAEKLLDEAPQAYKSIDQVMEDQRDLVKPVATLHQVANYKGVDSGRRRKRK